jgi:hypothetical protein
MALSETLITTTTTTTMMKTTSNRLAVSLEVQVKVPTTEQDNVNNISKKN